MCLGFHNRREKSHETLGASLQQRSFPKYCCLQTLSCRWKANKWSCNPTSHSEWTDWGRKSIQKQIKHWHQTSQWNGFKSVFPAGGADLQDLYDLQFGVHHHYVLIVRQEVSFAIAQGGRGVREAVRHSSTHNHLSHHFSNSVDGAQDVVS